MTALEKQLTAALWKAWNELNTIRARDGVPYTHLGYRAGVAEDYFSAVVDECEVGIQAATGQPPQPWPPKL